MTIAAMRSALADSLRTVSGLRAFEEIPDQFAPPTAIVSLNTVEYHQAFAGGLNLYRFTVRVVVGRASERNAQRYLDLYIEPSGDSSIRQVLESNRTLSGACQDLVVESMPNIGSITVNENEYLAAEFTVTVYA